jgi:hypothetical protein
MGVGKHMNHLRCKGDPSLPGSIRAETLVRHVYFPMHRTHVLSGPAFYLVSAFLIVSGEGAAAPLQNCIDVS